MNLLTIRAVSRLGISDSCPFGMGGFTWSERAWRLRVPPHLKIYGDSTANNVLEFLAMVVTIWVMIIECRERQDSQKCMMSIGDNTSAIGWLFR
jgi:hypothetical protein